MASDTLEPPLPHLLIKSICTETLTPFVLGYMYVATSYLPFHVTPALHGETVYKKINIWWYQFYDISWGSA